MATFLELARKVARESGIVPGSGSQPSSVTGQSGELLKIVSWTADAWEWVQRQHTGWRWMRREFSGTTTAGSARYTAAGWSIDSFARWIVDRETYLPTSLYLNATGVADEGPIVQIAWEAWRARYGRGEQTNNRPTCYAISPADEFCLGAVPDDTYVVRGEYVKGLQSLTANEDVPEMPARFHDLIVWKALLLLAEFDEAPIHLARAARNFDVIMDQLERDQLDPIRMAARPIA